MVLVHCDANGASLSYNATGIMSMSISMMICVAQEVISSISSLDSSVTSSGVLTCAKIYAKLVHDGNEVMWRKLLMWILAMDLGC
eukprot:1827358-Amphidinium_carterae.1